MTDLQEFIGYINGFVWGPVMLVFLVGTGVLLTVRLRGIQLRRLPEGLRQVFGGRKISGGEGDISDTMNGAMAIPNLIGLVGLSGLVVRLTRKHFNKGELRL